MKKRIIVFRGSFDSLVFFAQQLAKAFEILGYPVLVTDMKDTDAALEQVYDFAEPGNTVAIFFNHGGLNLLTKDGKILWNEIDVDCYNWIVDHPMYYHEPIIFPIKKCTFLCVDQYHQKFIERFYGGRRNSYFLPLAGCSLKDEPVLFQERSMDLLFTGAYLVDNSIELHTAGLSEGLADIWKECFSILCRQTHLTIEQAIETCLRKKGIQLPEEDLRDTVRLFKDMDGMLRSKARADVIKTLADHDVKVYVYGEGWEYLDCKQENLIIHPRVSFEESVQLAADAKIVLNVMPWFKAGVHDRVYTAMLNQSVSLTDGSEYLNRELTDGENVIFYSIDELESLPEIINSYLGRSDLLEQIAKNGYSFSQSKESWQSRAETLKQIFEG